MRELDQLCPSLREAMNHGACGVVGERDTAEIDLEIRGLTSEGGRAGMFESAHVRHRETPGDADSHQIPPIARSDSCHTPKRAPRVMGRLDWALPEIEVGRHRKSTQLSGPIGNPVFASSR
jgi:hypothetical protein